jgi:cyclohexanecarboxylate-CoA ligase
MTQELPKVTDRYSAEEIEGFYKAGYWSDQTLIDLVDHWAAQRPGEVFATDGTTSLTFGDLRERAYRVAAGLARSGIKPDERVMIQLPNWTDFIVAFVAVARCRAIVVPMMTIYRHDEVAYVLQHSGARAAITCTEFGGFGFARMFEDLRSTCPELDAIYLARAETAVGDAQPLESLSAEGNLDAIIAELGPGPGADDGHLIIYTSGTTARPKGCFHTWNTVAFTARVMAENLACNPGDIAFGPSPVAHGTGYMI